MNNSRSKYILIAYALIWVMWLSINPSGAIEPMHRRAMIGDSSNVPETLDISMTDINGNETCKSCHMPGKKLIVDLEDPECIGCHQVPEEELDHSSGMTIPVPQAVPVVLFEQPEPNKMIHIPFGEFLMGSNGRTTVEGSGNADEGPLHKVYVSGFDIDKYEVTNEQFKAFVDAKGLRPARHWKNGTYPQGKADHPVIYINWFEANAYCHWVEKRLPSEPEWEKAARGTEGLRFPWGNNFDPHKANTPQRWLAINQKADTSPVGSFENGKSPYGVYDMAGNVYEWTSNWYKPYPNNAVPNVHYGEKNKVVRGGSWYDCLSYGCGLSAPTFNRSRFAPAIRNKSFGFRCAKS